VYKIGTIREFKTQNFHVVVDAVEENCPDLSFDYTGETARKIDNVIFILFCARARCFFRGLEVASDYLGNCIYKSLDDFQDHKECGAQNRRRVRREGLFQIYRKARPYEHCLSTSDKLKKRGFATRERAEVWAKANAKEPYEIHGTGRCGSYFADMVSNVCKEGRKAVLDMSNIKMRRE
jgi:hypothetical protein